MKTLTLVMTLAAGLAPSFALAQSCSHGKSAQISCADGQNWDETTRSCVPISS
ncbi:MAG: carbohydrate-binding module family 14 protein [Albidovulum sp.]